MRIDNLLYLIGGELKNSPTISTFNAIQLSPQKIKRGDLFFAVDKDEIDEAIKNGAYGIVFEGWIQITDPEIAWIQVSSLQTAALKLLRFFLINKRIPLHLFDPVSFDLAQEFINDNLLYSFADPLKDLTNITKKEPLAVIMNDTAYFRRLALDEAPLERKSFQLVAKYLLESSFIYEGRFYERVPIAPLFLDQLQNVLALAATYNLTFTLHRPPTALFSPRFIDADFRQVDFGNSEKVLIIHNYYHSARHAKVYLLRNAPWAKTVFLSDTELDGYTYVPHIEGLKEILYNRVFNYALYIGKPFAMDVLTKQRVQKTLF